MRLNLLAIFLFLYITNAIPLLESRNEGDTLPNPEPAESSPQPESGGARPGTAGSSHTEADVGPSNFAHEPHDDLSDEEQHHDNTSRHETNVYPKPRGSRRRASEKSQPSMEVRIVGWFAGKRYADQAKEEKERKKRRQRKDGGK